MCSWTWLTAVKSQCWNEWTFLMVRDNWGCSRACVCLHALAGACVFEEWTWGFLSTFVFVSDLEPVPVTSFHFPSRTCWKTSPVVKVAIACALSQSWNNWELVLSSAICHRLFACPGWKSKKMSGLVKKKVLGPRASMCQFMFLVLRVLTLYIRNNLQSTKKYAHQWHTWSFAAFYVLFLLLPLQ